MEYVLWIIWHKLSCIFLYKQNLENEIKIFEKKKKKKKKKKKLRIQKKI